MKLGFQVSRYDVQPLPGRLKELAQRLEEAGFDSLWLMDHLFQIEELGPAEQDMLECYTALGFLAGVTSRLRLGAMVSSVTFRHPAVLMKAACTLDVLSSGRAWLGLGAGWYEREHQGLGIPFPATAERFERLEECLQVINLMKSGRVEPFLGKHYRLKEPICQPSTRVPVLVGGMGEQKTLRMVAQYADACNLFQGPEVGAKLEVLRRHCQALGRDFEGLAKTTLGVYVPGKRREFLRELQHLKELGVSLAVVGLLEPWNRAHLDELISVQRSLLESHSGP
ncbi:LLM class F420-dependent oxidoreductase [bacterium]|nr:LLM class F420-dependent oxidoreductase [bacterium]